MGPSDNNIFSNDSNSSNGGLGQMGNSVIYSGSATNVVSSNDGDIVLVPDDKKRKGLIVGVVIGCTVLLAIVIGLIVLAINSSNSSNGMVSENYHEAFDEYTNYVWFGDNSEEDIDWNSEKFFADSFFYKNMESSLGTNEKVSVLDRMRELYNIFSESFIGKRSDHVDDVQKYGGKIDLLYTYYTDGLPSKDIVLDAFLNKGVDGANEVIDGLSQKYEKYNDLQEGDISFLVKNFGNNQLISIEKYNEVGCIDANGVNYACVNSKDVELSNLSTISSNSFNDIRIIINSCIDDIVSDLQSLETVIESNEDGSNNEA